MLARDVQMGKQAVVLKDHADPPPTQRLIDPTRGVEEGRALEPNLTRVGRGQSRDQPQQRRLAGSRRPEDDADLATEPETNIEQEPGMDPVDHLNVQDLGERVAHRASPRDGRVR